MVEEVILNPTLIIEQIQEREAKTPLKATQMLQVLLAEGQ
jgi:hypothetical protein